ncbi:molybdenum cofactor biosynthesis protein MoaE [Yoonia litorea]|uniref:Molybdopterin synthase catalytic subunit n=1 Tax=Yoonia litorea TaxID=1123755 RepID=A0A1I6N2L6_9RHOB|nr:molybdenum cofactor biosynthesis protein MoaE [Yoonia litorea]SFS22199.1 molybdopterin synthase subunit MoaE [Yoonia litorea]
MRVLVQSEAFDAGAELNRFSAGHSGVGAVVSFTGVVRDSDGDLQEMVIEHYPGMTEKAITKILEEAMSRWALADALVIHRHGPLKTGDQIMMVATASAHRAAAFEAADFLMDYLKSRAPFWKKEVTDAGSAWVEAKDADEDALKRW